jgi:hypothetical protein
LVLSIGHGVQVGCRWFWGFNRVQDIKGGCAAVFDVVWGIESDWGVAFNGVQGVENGWNANLEVFEVFVIGSGVLTTFIEWRVAV